VAAVGETVSVSLANPTNFNVRGEFRYPPDLLRNARAGSDTGGSTPFEMLPGGSTALILRTLPAAAGRTTEVTVSITSVNGSPVGNGPVQVGVGGTGRIEVRNAR
jgi:hypothetical protein